MNSEGVLEGLIGTARRRARRKTPSTAELLLTILQRDPESARILSACQVREQDLVSALKVTDEEPASAIEVAVERATALAQRTGASHVRPLHLLLALLCEPRCSAYRCLEHTGVSAARVREAIQREIDPGAAVRAPSEVPRAIPRRTASACPTPTTPPVLRTQAPRVAPERGPRPEPAPRLAPPANRRVAPKAVEPASRCVPESVERARSEAPASPFELDRDRFPLLASIGRNLVALAAAQRIDPVFGRDKEIEQILDVLGRRRANNPLLVGPPGVGKTAIVEGLALAMVRPGTRTPGLEGKLLIEVSAGSLVSGAGVRGAVADRVRRLRDEVARSEGRILLFLDEIHAIAGSEGLDDVAGELKSALARGELSCIGATTEAEYRKYIERDPALARRFTRVDVEEPDPESAIRILERIAPRYEIHHAVAYDPEAIRAAVELSVRFLPERYLPDKALATLDLAAARVARAGGSIVGVEAVARVISDEAHVPVERLLMRDADRLLALESYLEARVVGQREPIARIADALRKGAAGFRGKRPLGTFLLLGPTGVGKTETAKAIADLLFGPQGMARFDMSEYSEPHAVARLLGAPPGYVGYEEGGQLTERVRRRPYQLVLLDEIEKAHPDVLLALLPLLDEGRLTDGRGRTVDFTNTVIVMTSNLGAHAAAPARAIGFGAETGEVAAAAAERAIAAARKALPPELWNRIDEPLFFSPLSERAVRTIAGRMLDHVAEIVHREHDVELTFDPSALDALIAAGGFDPALGARPMRRVVGRLVEAPLAAKVLAGEIGAGDRVLVRGAGAVLHVEIARGGCVGAEAAGDTRAGAVLRFEIGRGGGRAGADVAE
jgi:ATP-dependent Clp protease ATP-binding subunit ClpC